MTGAASVDVGDLARDSAVEEGSRSSTLQVEVNQGVDAGEFPAIAQWNTNGGLGCSVDPPDCNDHRHCVV